MAGFTEYLTQEGQRMLAKMASGTKISFTKVAYGDGTIEAGKNPRVMTSLVAEVMSEDISSVNLNGKNNVVIKAFIDTSKITDGFWLREKGIYMSDGTKEVLGIYSNKGNDAEYIEKSTGKLVQRTIKTILTISDSDMANIEMKSSEYASAPIKSTATSLEEFLKDTEVISSLEIGDTIIIDKYVYTLISEDATDKESYNCAGKTETVSNVEDAEKVTEAGTAADIIYVKEVQKILQEQIDNNQLWIGGTLEAGEKSITLSNDKIKNYSMIETILNDGEYGEMCADEINVEDGRITLNYPNSSEKNINIRIKVVN